MRADKGAILQKSLTPLTYCYQRRDTCAGMLKKIPPNLLPLAEDQDESFKHRRWVMATFSRLAQSAEE